MRAHPLTSETTDTARPKDVPVHVAVIMDGNGRWAKARGLPRTAGHKRGADAVKRVVKSAGTLGISYLTLFGFSSENWQRPESEVRDLLGLLRFYLENDIAELVTNGRQEIVSAARQLAADVASGKTTPESIDEHAFAAHLFTAGTPDPDLLIRTSGEQRISNFLLWQLAYSELVFTDTLWPDFGHKDLEDAIATYRSRERRYGAVTA
jgi:undecaprenyl diphosphate synthase